MSKTNTYLHFPAVRNVFFSEISIGISANAFLLLFHILMFLLKQRPKPTDLTIGHLALVHLVMLIIGVIATDVFKSWELWDDFKCKTLFHFYRVLRGLSLGTTSLLSVLQAITLSPSSSWLAKFKQTSYNHILHDFLFLWVFNLYKTAHLLLSTVATKNGTSNGLLFFGKSCSLLILNNLPRHTLHILGIIQDVFLLCLMALSSAYMVTLLCRHRRQSWYLHGTSLSPRASPELRATRTILLLMGVFVLLSLMDCIVYSFSGISWTSDLVRLCVQMLVGNGYASIAPLLLISREKRLIKFFKSMCRNENK